MVSEEEELEFMRRELRQLRNIAIAADHLIASRGGCFDMAIALVELNTALDNYTEDKE